MSTRKKPIRRLAAVAGAFALAMSGTFISVGAANADPGVEGTPPGNTAVGTTGQLTVHKRVGVQQTTAHNGSSLGDTAPGTPLKDVTFTAQRVGVWAGSTCNALDLRTTAGWDAAAAVQAGTNPGAPVATPADGALCASGVAASEITADDSGAAVFSGLPLGLYYVVEGAAPDNVIDKALPFYVTIPFPSANGAVVTWLYDVHVYPKNAIADKPVKTIADRPNSVVIGSNVTWTITQKIPTLSSTAASFTDAKVEDTLDPLLTYVSSTVNIVPTPTAPKLDLVAEDFTFTSVSGQLTWTLSSTGLEKLKDNQDSSLVVSVVTTVNDVASGELTPGKIANAATVTINKKPGVAPPSYTYWGNLVVNKLEGVTPLAGAVFDVFDMTEATCATTHPGGTALATGTSDTTGVVQWGNPAAGHQGLWIANSNTELTNPTKAYCLYETQAPAGYTKITTPTVVTITTADLATLTQDIQNVKVPGPDLPLTGSSGTIMLTIAGLGLIGLGTGGIMLRRRTAKRN